MPNGRRTIGQRAQFLPSMVIDEDGVTAAIERLISRGETSLQRSPTYGEYVSRYEESTLGEVHELISEGLITMSEVRLNPSGECSIDRSLINQRITNRNNNASTVLRSVAQPQIVDEDVEMPEWASLNTDYSNQNDEDENEDEDCNDTPKWKTIKPNDFPAYNIPTWKSEDEREEVVDRYFKQVEYRLRWIFYREEREGFRRRSHGIQPFNRQDFMDKVAKKGIVHELNTAESTFYDWNIGATDFILRFENFRVDGIDAMRIHFIYKSNRLEVGYQDRIWDGRQYQDVTQQWAEIG